MEFNYKQLIFAREYRGYTQTDLSSKIDGLSQSNLSKFEKGISLLSDEIILKIIRFLNFPESFFEQKISNLPENAHYRKRATISKKLKTNIEYSNRVIGYIVDQMSDSVEWPEFTFKQLDIQEGFTPETIASYTRKTLNIPIGDPVKSICNLLEYNGIIIIEYESTEKFDGVSFWSDKGNPIIIINKTFSNDRKRFTLAHELGHILMHNFAIPDHRDKEKEANQFASEFLMPAESIKHTLKNLKISSLAEIKRYWLTSMASIIRRAKDLNYIDKDKYLYLNIELSRTGKKRKEDVEVYIDEPKLFIEAYKLHKNELEYTDEELCVAFHLPVDIINRFCTYSRPNSKLRVVI